GMTRPGVIVVPVTPVYPYPYNPIPPWVRSLPGGRLAGRIVDRALGLP
ncbi:MAG: hypothetical protein IRY99_22505, partial [Isosphaeraceae bacterium]|nr:hypothetical protein [Isosphaeraceae bacterium]